MFEIHTKNRYWKKEYRKQAWKEYKWLTTEHVNKAMAAKDDERKKDNEFSKTGYIFSPSSYEIFSTVWLPLETLLRKRLICWE